MSKIQFNLLPDVKLDYIKTERTRNTVIAASIIVSAVSLAIFLALLFTVGVLQKKQLSDARIEVEKASKDFQDTPELGSALTVQNQLTTLSGLHKDKNISSRIFNYLPQLTPTNVNISSLTVDFENSTMTVTGTAVSQQAVNTFIDTLKFTTYKIGSGEAVHAFPSVIESSFGIAAGNVSYGLNIQFDPKLFSNDILNSDGEPQAPQLSVPTLTTTRSVLELTSNPLFKAQRNAGSSSQGGGTQ